MTGGRFARRLQRSGSEDGAVIVIVVITMLAIFAVVAVVLDIGASLVVKRQVVAAADSAALAAAQSCATGKGLGDAAAQADAYATDNRPGVQGSITSADCVTGSGSVSTAYSSNVAYNVAPIAGLGSNGNVGAKATAIWGPARQVEGAVPIMLDSTWLKDNCHLPEAPVGTQCAFWYDNSNTTSGSQNNWGFMNLDQWDVAAGYNCSNAGASNRGDWITQGYPGFLAINYPEPTYVCSDSGHASGNWEKDLGSVVGQIRSFPLTDPSQQIPAYPSAADKYDVIGWTDLKIVQVLKGNDPAAIGSTTTGTCSGDWTPLPVKNATKRLDSMSCFPSTYTTIGTPTLTGMLKNKKQTFVEGTDYRYDPATRTLTWLDDKPKSLTISFDWTFTSGGACPDHASNPNAVCLVTQWMGTRIGGQEPCDQQASCPDFGLPAVRLSE